MEKKPIIPLSPLPIKMIEDYAPSFLTFGRLIVKAFPSLKDSLRQGEYPYLAKDYASIAFTISIINSFAILFLMLMLGFIAQINLYLITFAAFVLVFIFSMLTVLAYPSIVNSRRQKSIDAQLIPALRQLLIEVRSGVPLFNSMASLTYDYGEVSDQFRRIVQIINAGTPEIDTLTDSASSTPSAQFRKVLWQISNALKVGSDVSNVLESQVAELTRTRVDQIRRYGQELSPWTMIYMMAAVIMPSLGVAMLIVVISFLGSPLPKFILYILLGGLMGFQLFFLNFVSSRRPTI